MRIARNIHSIFVFISLAAIGVIARDVKVSSVLGMPEFVHDWEISKQFTIEVANAMPAELYTFKPNPEEMSFGEQINHIALSNAFRFNQITGVKPPFPLDLKNPPAADKLTTLRILEQSFDYVLAVLPNITNEQLKRTCTFLPGKPVRTLTAAR